MSKLTYKYSVGDLEVTLTTKKEGNEVKTISTIFKVEGSASIAKLNTPVKTQETGMEYLMQQVEETLEINDKHRVSRLSNKVKDLIPIIISDFAVYRHIMSNVDNFAHYSKNYPQYVINALYNFGEK